VLAISDGRFLGELTWLLVEVLVQGLVMAMGFGVRLEVLVGVDFLGFQVLGLGPLLALLSVGEVVLLTRLLPLLLLL